MPGDNILAIDNGTQSIRAMLFDPQGGLVDKTMYKRLKPLYQAIREITGYLAR